jgi:pimeloyl-ACP methyl ester carboxylesterase
MIGELINMGNTELKPTFSFPVGYVQFHNDKVYNFQLNRWYSLGYAKYSDLFEAAKRIQTFNDWKDSLVNLAQRAESEGRLIHAAYYYRAAEFYIPPNDTDKNKIYEKFISLIHPIMLSDGVEIKEVPYGEGAALPCLRLKHKGKANNRTVLIHGGFDSFKEEFYSLMKFFSNSGYHVILFEGPGQGAARRKYNLSFDYRWEKPVSAVLNYFGLQEATLVGISMGGYLCFRAAAFEPRIKRIIASSIAYDYSDFPAKILQPIVKLFYHKLTGFTSNEIRKAIQKGGMKSWYFNNLMYMLDTDKPIEAVQFITGLTADKLHCNRITQDVLILTGRNDHFVPFKMHKKQIDALIHANSVTGRVYRKESSASNHCQVGNMALALKTMLDWMDKR